MAAEMSDSPQSSDNTAMKLYIVTPNTFKPADDTVWATSLKMDARH